MKKLILGALTFLATLTLLNKTAFAESSAKVFKTYDGAVARCGGETTNSQQGFGTKRVIVELMSEAAADKTHNADLKISVVKCDGKKWILDQAPTTEQYVAPNGDNVEVKYSEFEALIVNDRFQIVSTANLSKLTTQSEDQFSAQIKKENVNPQDLEVIVRAKKSVRSSGGYMAEEKENFGSFRLRLNH